MTWFGFRGHHHWRDMSEYLVHFTGASEEGTALDNLASILADGFVRPSGPFGSARTLWALGDSQMSACFSEIPLDLLDRLVRRRSAYGVGFHQSRLIAQGGARVWYVEADSELGQTIAGWVTDEIGQWGSPLWQVTPFIDRPYGDDYQGYRFEWEREWRVRGGYPFEATEIALIFAPQSDHRFLADYWEGYIGEAAEDMPLVVDPTWARSRLQRLFLGLEPEDV